MKLTIEHLAPYLPYGVKLIDHLGNRYNVAYLSTKRISFIDIKGIGEVQKLRWEYTKDKIKPILRPLSDLTKEIEVNGEKFVPMEKLKKEVWSKFENIDSRHLMIDVKKLNSINLLFFYDELILRLFKWHFDVFELIENNLAIDINEL